MLFRSLLHLSEGLRKTLAFCRAGSVAPLMLSEAVLAMEAPRMSELCELTMGSLSMVGTLKDASWGVNAAMVEMKNENDYDERVDAYLFTFPGLRGPHPGGSRENVTAEQMIRLDRVIIVAAMVLVRALVRRHRTAIHTMQGR